MYLSPTFQPHPFHPPAPDGDFPLMRTALFFGHLFVWLALLAGCTGGDDRQHDAANPCQPPLNHLAVRHFLKGLNHEQAG